MSSINSGANPLLDPSTLPNHAPPFDKIKDEHYLPAVEAAIKEARANIEAIKANKEAPDFENTIVALESASETLGVASGVFYNQLSAMGGDALHALVEKIGPMSAHFSSDVILDEDLFARIKAVYNQRDTLTLTPEQSTLLEETYKDFVRGGALLDEGKKKRLREISQEMSVLGPSFMNNAKKSAEQFKLWIDNEEDLSGLPATARSAARHAAQEEGEQDKWLITLDMPSYIPFIQYADKRDLREKIWRAYASRAWGDEFDNSDNILKIVSLRHERAQLLGYQTHAHYVLEHRMAERPETVEAFLNKTKAAYKKAALDDLERLKSFAREEHGLDDLKPWDVTYYSEKLKQKLFAFSSEDLRPYFPLERVLEGCFEHFSKLFNVRFEPSNAYPVWHKDVKVFELYDKSDDRFIGTLYGDFFPRSGKKDGAWMTSYRDQGLFRGLIERPVTAIVCNFTKPTADHPSLLTHGEVTTLFHEMGHAMHGLLADTTYRSLSGTNVLWDFVELPSQLQENWCFEKEALDMFASHYETGEKIPSELIDKLVAAKNFMVGWAGLRQSAFGILDMAWHMTDPATIKDVGAFEDEHTADASLFPRLAGPFSAAFSHIFAGGYAAGYYSYKWAEVLEADAFELFLERGLYDRETGIRYRQEVLSKGGSEKPALLYHRFRGRDADPDALLRREGLLDAEEKAA
ncbi:MAG: M3 family metallopeptidase [Alphaproteobacteria bacterium]|nr:M3 family metallopeptidase [Alphaproteobacteria bacterium]